MFLLRVDVGAQVQLRYGPFEECQPVLRGRTQAEDLLNEFATRGLIGTVQLDLVVELDGSTSGFRITQSVTAQPFLDTAVIYVGSRLHFTPGLLNREPVRMRVVVPFQIAGPRPDR